MPSENHPPNLWKEWGPDKFYTHVLLVRGPPYQLLIFDEHPEYLPHVMVLSDYMESLGRPRAGCYSDYRNWCVDNHIPLKGSE